MAYTRSYLSLWQENMIDFDMQTQIEIKKLGLQVEDKSGHLFYGPDFVPVQLNDNEIILVRHGETFGNCGQATKDCKIDQLLVDQNKKNAELRTYQGNVDTEINQLTKLGRQQAINAADKLDQEFINKGWMPDIIFISPLNRAQETALPFVERHHFEDKCIIHQDVKEMSFGAVDNRRVCDIPPDHASHLFYKEQHALIKHSGINNNGIDQKAESFCDVLLRAHKFLNEISEKYSGKKIIIFSHSMFGAACSILLGHGQKIENDEYLAFDGKRKDNSCYTIPHATPILLKSKLPEQQTCLKI